MKDEKEKKLKTLCYAQEVLHSVIRIAKTNFTTEIAGLITGASAAERVAIFTKMTPEEAHFMVEVLTSRENRHYYPGLLELLRKKTATC